MTVCQRPLTSHLSPLTSHLSPLTSHLSPSASHFSPPPPPSLRLEQFGPLVIRFNRNRAFLYRPTIKIRRRVLHPEDISKLQVGDLGPFGIAQVRITQVCLAQIRSCEIRVAKVHRVEIRIL